MAESKIEWTDRSDWNPVRGCTRVSPGCGGAGPHGGCYAEALAARFSDPGQWGHGFAERTPAGGRWTGTVALIEDRLTLPLRWKKPAKIFASSTSDIFHEKLFENDIDRIFAVMALCRQHIFQVLTKRHERMLAYFSSDWLRERIETEMEYLKGEEGLFDPLERRSDDARATAPWICDGGDDWLLPNVWLGVSVEDQARADERREAFRAVPAAKKFVSHEPALGVVDWNGWEFVDQFIVGGESGPRARPMPQECARGTLAFCRANDIAFFFKQWGEHAPRRGPHGMEMQRVGKASAGRKLDGVEYSEFPDG